MIKKQKQEGRKKIIPSFIQNDLQCTICLHQYNSIVHIPMIICEQQHICCALCLQSLKEHKSFCPECRGKLLETPKKNRLISNMIEGINDRCKRQGLPIRPISDQYLIDNNQFGKQQSEIQIQRPLIIPRCYQPINNNHQIRQRSIQNQQNIDHNQEYRNLAEQNCSQKLNCKQERYSYIILFAYLLLIMIWELIISETDNLSFYDKTYKIWFIVSVIISSISIFLLVLNMFLRLNDVINQSLYKKIILFSKFIVGFKLIIWNMIGLFFFGYYSYSQITHNYEIFRNYSLLGILFFCCCCCRQRNRRLNNN